jgi:acyl carrier protein
MMLTSRLDRLVLELFDEESGALGDDTPFAESPRWDSLKHVELIVSIESRFGVELTADEIGQLTCKRAAREILAARRVDV